MRLYLEASVLSRWIYPAPQDRHRCWLSWSLEYLCVEHVEAMAASQSETKLATILNSQQLRQLNCQVAKRSSAQSKHYRTVKTTQKYDLIVTL